MQFAKAGQEIFMRHYDPKINMLAGLYDLLVAVVDGFPGKDFTAYTKKQKKYLISLG